MQSPPLNHKTIIRLLVLLVVLLAFVAGYLESVNYTYQRKIRILEKRLELSQETAMPATSAAETVQ